MRKYILFFLVLVLWVFAGNLKAQSTNSTRLNDNLKFLKSDLGGIWEAVRPVKEGNPESVPLWENVTLPHCFNASDAVDPDLNYYRAPVGIPARLPSITLTPEAVHSCVSRVHGKKPGFMYIPQRSEAMSADMTNGAWILQMPLTF